MTGRLTLLATVAALALICVGGAPARAQEASQSAPVELTGDQAFAAALQLFIRSGQYDKALNLLLSRPDVLERPDGVRLHAELLLRLGRPEAALKIIELWLAAHPDDALARFQLAEIYFAGRKDQAAALAYRMAMAGGLDGLRTRMAQTRMEAINARKSLKLWIGGSVSPDSNLNSGSDADQVWLFGLPFQLDADARPRTGVRVTAYGGAEKTFVVSPSLRIRATAAAQLNDLPGADLDNGYASLRAGPEWLTGPTSSLSLQATLSESWFGKHRAGSRRGLRLESDSYANNVRWQKTVAWDHIGHSLNPGRDGDAVSLSLGRTRFLQASSLWQANAGLAVLDARDASEAYTEGQLSAGRLYRGPLASLVYAEIGGAHRRYRSAAAAFGKVRRDTEMHLELRVSKRDWLIHGAHPYFGATATRNDSNLPLYRYSGVRAEFGLTREF